MGANVPIASDGFGGFSFNPSGILLGAGYQTANALDSQGYAWSWGRNTAGQIGDNTKTNRSSPVSVVGGKQFSQISGGYYFSVALDTQGYAWARGWNNVGQLGTNDGVSYSSPVSVVGGRQFVQLSWGSNFICALDQQGYAWAWGANDVGQLGNNSSGTSISSPVSVVGGKQFVRISGGFSFVTALDAQGYVWSWGYNGEGQLGVGNTVSYSSPVMVVRAML